MQRGLCPYASKTSLSSLSIPPPVFPLSRLCRGDKEYPTRNYLFPLFVDLFLVCLFSPSRLFFFFFPRAQSGPQLSKYLLNESCPLIGYKCPRGLERLNNFLRFMLWSQEHRSPPPGGHRLSHTLCLLRGSVGKTSAFGGKTQSVNGVLL